jgi:DNA repair exonuclease SbcCD ATPase subunit
MKLVSCYITAFGKFNNQAFDLSRDIVEIKENNGWGKTTLVSFIESMLFGMDASRGRQIAEDIRQKYQPFQGGSYGGSLTFSHQNNVYRIERTFGKTPAGDTVKLYDKNNLPSFAFGEHVENIGELLFGINRESYHRTAFIAQGEIAQEGLPEDTKARLVALLSAENDKQSGAQTALQRLDKAEAALRGKRAPKNGLLDQIDARLQALDEEKRACQQAAVDLYSAQKQLQELYTKQDQKQNEIQRLSAERDTFAQNSERAVARARRQEVERQITRIEERMDRLRSFFREIDPLTVNIMGIEGAVQEYYQLQAWFQENKAYAQAFSQQQGEQRALWERYQALQDELHSLEHMLNQENQQAQKAFRETQKQDKAQEKKRKLGTWRLLLALIMALLGATQIDSLPIIGWPLVALGGGFVAYVFSATLLSTRFWKRPKWRKTFADKQMSARYKQVKEECKRLKEQLSETAFSTRQAQAILHANWVWNLTATTLSPMKNVQQICRVFMQQGITQAVCCRLQKRFMKARLQAAKVQNL